MTPEIDWLAKWNLYSPKAVAVFDEPSGREITYGKLFRKSKALALKLRADFGIQAGDRVAVMATNCVEYIPLFFAIQRLNAIMVPVNFRLTTREVEHIIQDSGARLFIYEQNFAHIADDLSIIHDFKVDKTTETPAIAEIEK